MKKIFILLTLIAFAVSCSYVHVDKNGIEELGVYQNEYELPSDEGMFDLRLIANGPSTIACLTSSDWLTLQSDRFNSDCTIKIKYDANEGFPRYATLLVSLDSNPKYSRDTVTVYQRGAQTPYFELIHSAVVIKNGEKGENVTEVAFNTNVPYDNLTIKPRILDGAQEWITDIRMENVSESNGKVYLTTLDNEGNSKRTAAVSFQYDNGWGKTETVNLRLTQADRDDNLGEQKSFEELRAMANSGSPLTDDMYIVGHVVSDVKSGNVNENPMLSSSSIDYSVSERSAYVQSLDGKLGFLVITTSEEDNILTMDTEVQISLGGVKVKRYDNPERYVLEGLTDASLMKAEVAIVPDREIYMKDLKPEDIYTRVILKDVEWPVRKGSLSPGFERMTNAAGVEAATKFATLLRDINGNSMYVYTNTTCVYRRDGSRMPYGSGNLRGVIVHEKHRPFVDMDAPAEADCGNIGTYQIRHNSREDFMMDADFANSFSEIICEFSYLDKDDNGVLQATYGTGTMTHTRSNGSSYSYYDFSYLGPIGTDDSYYFGKHFGNINGFGITTRSGEEYGMNLTDVNSNMYNAGRSGKSDNLSWAADYWWNDGPYHWIVEFSTSGITTDMLSLQFAMLNQVQSEDNGTTNNNAPRYWRVEWGIPDEDGIVTEWTTVAGAERFAIPDITPSSAPLLLSMSCAFKPMDFKLPLEMLGKDKVCVRIGPAENNAGQTLGGAVYEGKTIGRAPGAGSMNYFAIRYNK